MWTCALITFYLLFVTSLALSLTAVINSWQCFRYLWHLEWNKTKVKSVAITQLFLLVLAYCVKHYLFLYYQFKFSDIKISRIIWKRDKFSVCLFRFINDVIAIFTLLLFYSYYRVLKRTRYISKYIFHRIHDKLTTWWRSCASIQIFDIMF